MDIINLTENIVFVVDDNNDFHIFNLSEKEDYDKYNNVLLKFIMPWMDI